MRIPCICGRICLFTHDQHLTGNALLEFDAKWRVYRNSLIALYMTKILSQIYLLKCSAPLVVLSAFRINNLIENKYPVLYFWQIKLQLLLSTRSGLEQ